jgi:hypothetical protein
MSDAHSVGRRVIGEDGDPADLLRLRRLEETF